MATRLYVVTMEGQDMKDARLVNANSAAQALKHCTTQYVVTVAKAQQVADLMAHGISVENAAAE